MWGDGEQGPCGVLLCVETSTLETKLVDFEIVIWCLHLRVESLKQRLTYFFFSSLFY